MRFFLATTLAIALAVDVAAANGNDKNDGPSDSPLGQYKAQFQNFLGRIAGYVNADPEPVVAPRDEPVAAAEEPLVAREVKMAHLNLDSWKETLYAPVEAATTTPEEWWVLITGRNKTCYGHCEKVEEAFNVTAGRFAVSPDPAPHMAILNCDEQPVLCSSWSASAGSIWAFDMLPPPAPIDIYKRRLNLTSTTSDDLVALRATGKKSFSLVDSWFHPFNGKLAELGLSVPVGYLFWGFGLIPNWAFMLIVSMLSRTMMGNRMQPQQRRGAPASTAAQ